MANLAVEFVKKFTNIEYNKNTISGEIRGFDVVFDNESRGVRISSDAVGFGYSPVHVSLWRDGTFDIYVKRSTPEESRVIENVNKKFVMKNPDPIDGNVHIGVKEATRLLTKVIPGANDKIAPQHAFVEVFEWWYETLHLDNLPVGAIFMGVK